MVSKTLRKGGGGSLQKKFFLAFGPQFGLKLRGERGVGPFPGSATAYATCISPIIHFISPPPKKKKKKICITFFSFILGITAIPSEIEKNAYAKCFFFWGGGRGANKVHYGRCVSAIFSNL